ncbi:MAG: hypothetical protein ACLFU9_02425 [Candidatus Bathyarchaeia archaeon]
MSEFHEVPVPLINYLHLIERKASPYYDLISYLIADMEENYKKEHPRRGTIYTINPRRLKEEINKKIPSEKLTPINISRTILALLYGSKLQKDEDYYVTTSSGGRKNYHIKVDNNILSTLRMHL